MQVSATAVFVSAFLSQARDRLQEATVGNQVLKSSVIIAEVQVDIRIARHIIQHRFGYVVARSRETNA